MSNNQIQAGVADRGLEFFKSGDKTLATYSGHTYKFRELPNMVLNLLRADLLLNERAQAALTTWNITDEMERLEKYASCRFGGVDKFSDITSCGKLTPDYHDCPSRGTCPFNGVICVKPAGKNGELSDRELQILKLIAQGRMEKEIADELRISQACVTKRRKAIFKKTDTASSISLTHWAIARNLIPVSHEV